MSQVLVAFALILHLVFWGMGAAVLAMPARWRAFWPALAFPVGCTLQATVVWGGAWAGLRGTDSYGWLAEIVPILLLGIAIRRRGVLIMRNDVARFGMVWAATAASLALLVAPMTGLRQGLTTLSLGSCDAADYAAGARVLMEFAHGDRIGFLGLTEVVSILSVDNFFDVWLRLNHFTPSALMALNGSILSCEPHEIATLLTMVLLAGSVPVVFWMARGVVGLRGAPATVVGALYGMNPVTWYAVAHVAPAQLLAAQAIAVITWAGFALWRALSRRRTGWQFMPLLAIGYGLILTSYNFIIIVCLAPAGLYAAGCALRGNEWRRFGHWIGAMILPLVFGGVVFHERVAGLAERFLLFRTYDFGWPIPALSLDGWLGFLRTAANLEALEAPWRIALTIAIAGIIAAALATRRTVLGRAACLVAPALAGYFYLLIRGALLGTNASYDAYKLLAVFFPGILAVSMVWLRWVRSPQRWLRMGTFVLAALVIVAHGRSVSQFNVALRNAPLRVTPDLRRVGDIEKMADVGSLNMRIPDMWSRLWANALLLRKPQYFLTHTYEGRLNTPLRGEWDLLGGVVAVTGPDGNPGRRVGRTYSVVDLRSSRYLRVDLGPGWHPEERAPNGERWHWSAEAAELHFENPQVHPLVVRVRLDGLSMAEREIGLMIGETRTPVVPFSRKRGTVTLGPVSIPPGQSSVVLWMPQPATFAPGDSRPLGIRVWEIEVQVDAN